MATTVYKIEELLLEDGSVITCKPANIALLRKGTDMLEDIGKAEDNDEGIKRMLDVVVLCLKKQRPDFEKDEPLTDEKGEAILGEDEKSRTKKVPDYELLEELFDIETVFKVIELYLGVKLNDPKLLEMAQELTLAQAQAGTS